MPPPAAPPVRSKAAEVGVPTTTPIAFLWGDKLYLERMNVLGLDGCGVLCADLPSLGTILKVAFRLSSAKELTRCTAEVLGGLPTTPTGFELQRKHGAKVVPAITAAGITDSATAIFRISDLKPQSAKPSASASPDAAASAAASAAPLTGFCIHFLDLDAAGRAAVAQHLETSRRMADRLSAAGGRSDAADRLAISETFHEGDLADRARDW